MTNQNIQMFKTYEKSNIATVITLFTVITVITLFTVITVIHIISEWSIASEMFCLTSDSW